MRERLVPFALIERLRTIPLVGRQEEVALGFLAEMAEPRELARGEAIYDSVTPQDSIYLVDQGQVRLVWDDGKDNWLGNGAVFGLTRDAYGDGDSRHMGHTATATVRTKLLVLPHAQYVDIVGERPDGPGLREMEEREEVLERLYLFSRFSKEYDHHMAGYVSHYYFPYSHVIVQQGEEADSLWVLMRKSRAAIQAKPDFFDPHFNLGVLLHSLGRRAEAAPLLHRALELRPWDTGKRATIERLLTP